MTDINMLESEFKKEWENVGVYHGKSLINNLPSWEHIVHILNNFIVEDQEKNPQDIFAPHEIRYKNIVAVKKFLFETGTNESESDATFFFALFLDYKNKPLSIFSKEIRDDINLIGETLKIDYTFHELKICLSDKIVPYEFHKNNTYVIQLQGINEWKLKNTITGLESSYILEPGDCLFFKEYMPHSLTNKAPRSSLIGNFSLRDEESMWGHDLGGEA